MNGFSVILRDIMVILAASALFGAACFGVLVLWQLYRLGRDIHTEIQPVVTSARETSASVRDTAQFVNRRVRGRVAALVSLGYTAHAFYTGIHQFLGDIRAPEPASAPPPLSEAAGGNGPTGRTPPEA